VNSIVRGWCNFYSTGNSKNCFSNIRRWLFLRIYKYLFKFYSSKGQFKKKSQLYKKKISSAIFRNNLLPTLYNPSVRWFGIPSEYIPLNKRGYDQKPYFLINPGAVEVSTPSIITGKSCFYSTERQELLSKAIYWQKGLLKKLLIKSKGKCQNCGCALVDLQEFSEIHHIQPKMFKGEMRFTNLAVLCKDCHTLVTNAVKAKDLEEIAIYESNKILKDVSIILGDSK
jgi:RNA-directed DNA polymerase